MTRKQKLLDRFLSIPSDFHFREMASLLGYFGYREVRTGKTAGSRVRFENKEGVLIMLHKPHPNGIMKKYQMKQIKEILGL